MFVPEPVVVYSIAPEDKSMLDKMGRALQRFSKEDPTLRITRDPESGETLIAGMGELQIDVYVERMRELGVQAVLARVLGVRTKRLYQVWGVVGAR